MKKTIVFLYFAFLPFITYSQFHPSIDFISSVDYTQMSGILYISPGVIFRQEDIKHKLNYRVGADINLYILDKVILKTGLRFVQMGFTEKLEKYYVKFIPNVNLPFPFDPYLPPYIYNSYDQKLLEMPLVGRYEFNDNKISMFVEFGMSANMKISTKNTKINSSREVTVDGNVNFNGNKRLIIGLVGGVGAKFKLTADFEAFAQPTFRYYPNVDDHATRAYSLKNISLEFGIRMALSKK